MGRGRAHEQGEVVEKVKTRSDKVIKEDIKWYKQFVTCGKSVKMKPPS